MKFNLLLFLTVLLLSSKAKEASIHENHGSLNERMDSLVNSRSKRHGDIGRTNQGHGEKKYDVNKIGLGKADKVAADASKDKRPAGVKPLQPPPGRESNPAVLNVHPNNKKEKENNILLPSSHPKNDVEKPKKEEPEKVEKPAKIKDEKPLGKTIAKPLLPMPTEKPKEKPTEKPKGKPKKKKRIPPQIYKCLSTWMNLYNSIFESISHKKISMDHIMKALVSSHQLSVDCKDFEAHMKNESKLCKSLVKKFKLIINEVPWYFITFGSTYAKVNFKDLELLVKTSRYICWSLVDEKGKIVKNSLLNSDDFNLDDLVKEVEKREKEAGEKAEKKEEKKAEKKEEKKVEDKKKE